MPVVYSWNTTRRSLLFITIERWKTYCQELAVALAPASNALYRGRQAFFQTSCYEKEKTVGNRLASQLCCFAHYTFFEPGHTIPSHTTLRDSRFKLPPQSLTVILLSPVFVLYASAKKQQRTSCSIVHCHNLISYIEPSIDTRCQIFPRQIILFVCLFIEQPNCYLYSSYVSKLWYHIVWHVTVECFKCLHYKI